MSNKNLFKKGSIELLVLSLLNNEDYYGYQITQAIDQLSGGVIKVTEGSLYPTLYKLSEKGYISDQKRLVGKRLTRVYYHLEPSGVKYYYELLHAYYDVHNGIHAVLAANHAPTAEELSSHYLK